ncbi:ATP-binding protein [Sphaerisporangium perillae]|uniref:ATP-binding protein n=1 Tax=Sphaerisporangium perillae TaxID=2935860 RepID=UPI00200BA826|nr:ATP-binding protein [Sphaerisporangium perillae]
MTTMYRSSNSHRYARAAVQLWPAGQHGRRASWVLVPEPTTVPKTRARVRGRLADWGVQEQADVVELLVSEVVTNAMRHSWGAVMTLSMDDDRVCCEVQDTNPAMPMVREVHEGDEGGRGMYLMEALSTSWGSHALSTGKVVWFEVACEPATGAAGSKDGRGDE